MSSPHSSTFNVQLMSGRFLLSKGFRGSKTSVDCIVSYSFSFYLVLLLPFHFTSFIPVSFFHRVRFFCCSFVYFHCILFCFISHFSRLELTQTTPLGLNTIVSSTQVLQPTFHQGAPLFWWEPAVLVREFVREFVPRRIRRC